MLVGERVVLRARRRSDVEARHVALAGDFAVHALTDYAPWRPTSLESAFAEYDQRLGQTPDPATERFTVGRRGDPAFEWIGEASLWGIEEHQRTARVGLVLASESRGQGLGTDVVRVLCEYAFRVRDLHRLALETLASNEPMMRAARTVGFREEGRLREAAYVLGSRVDEVVFGLLRWEWHAARTGSG